MKISSEIRFADENLKKLFYKLQDGDNQERELFKIINQAFDNIEKDAQCGIHIAKKFIPKEYVKNYGINNLWKYDLPKGWRLIYAIERGEIIVICLVLEWFDHKDYEKRFKY